MIEFYGTPQRRDIPVASLTVPEWHRPVNRQKVEDIEANYDRTKLGFLNVVDLKDGTFMIHDGAIRAAAVRHVEGEEAVVPCRVYT